MKSSKLKFFIALVFVFILGCQKKADEPKIAVITNVSTAKVIDYPFLSQAKTAEEHLAEYRADKNACAHVFKLIAKDEEFVEELKYSRDGKTSFDILANSKFAKHLPVKHILNGRGRFEIETDFHMDYPVNLNELYCHVKLLPRVQAIEDLGFSQYAWEVREELLTFYFDRIQYPKVDMTGGYFLFDSVFSMIEKTSKNYSNGLRQEFLIWLDAAIYEMTKELLSVDDNKDSSTPIEKQRKIIESWIEKMEALRK